MNRYLVLVYRLIIVVLTIIPFTSQILLAQNESTNISYEDAYRVFLEVDANPKYKGLIFYESYEEGKLNSDRKQKELPMKEYIKDRIRISYSGPENNRGYTYYLCSSVKEVREKIENAYEFVYNMNHHDTGRFSVVEIKEKIDKNGYYRYHYWCQPDSIFIRTRLFNKDSFFTEDFLSTKDKINTFVDSISNMIESSRSFLQCSLDSTAMANYKDEGLSYRDFLIKKCDEDDELQDRFSSEWRLRFAALTFVKELSDLQKKQIFCGQYNNMITNLKKERKENYDKLQALVKDFKALGYSYIKDTPILKIQDREYEIPDGKVYVEAFKGLSVDSLYSLYRKHDKEGDDITENSKDFLMKISSNKRLCKHFKKVDKYMCLNPRQLARYILNNPFVLETYGKMDISERDYCIKYIEEFYAKYNSHVQLSRSFRDYVTEWIKNNDEFRHSLHSIFFLYLKDNWDLDLDGELDAHNLIFAFDRKIKQGVEHLEYKGNLDFPNMRVIYCGKNEMIVAAGFSNLVRYFRLKDGRWARQQHYNGLIDKSFDDMDMFRSYPVIRDERELAIKVYGKSINRDMLPFLGDEKTTANGRRLVDIANRMELPIDECGWYYKKESLAKRDLKAEDQMEILKRLLAPGEKCSTPNRKHHIGGEGGSVIYKDPEIVDLEANTDINELVLAVGLDYTNADGTKKYIDTMPSEDYIKFINVLKPKLEAEFLRRCNASDERDRKWALKTYIAAYGAAQVRAFLNNNKEPFKGMTLHFFRDEFGTSCYVIREDSNGNAIYKHDGGRYNLDIYYYFSHGVLTHWTYSN